MKTIKELALEEIEKRKELSSEKYFVEKKYAGLRASIHKKGDIVLILSESGEDWTSIFPMVVEEAKLLAQADFVLDCTFVPSIGKEPLNALRMKEILTKLSKQEEIDGLSVEFFVFDCPFFGRNIENLPLFERKKIFESLSFGETLKLGADLLVESRKELRKAIQMFSGMIGSLGSHVRGYDSRYLSGEDSIEWVEYLSEGNKDAEKDNN